MKTVCIYHSIDLDGWMSAAIVKHWYIDGGSRINGVGSTEGLTFIGYNYGQPVPDVSEYDRVIMCDISFPKENMTEIANTKELIWIDHHISAIKDNSNLIDLAQCEGAKINLKLDTKFSACELTWKYFFGDTLANAQVATEMPEIVRLLGRYDCFGHKGTPEEKKVLEFQYGARSCINNYEKAYFNLIKPVENTENIHSLGVAIYEYLCTEAKAVYKTGKEIVLGEPFDNELGLTIKRFIAINRERFNPINFGIDYHKDRYDGVMTYYYDKDKWYVSLYNDDGKTDCSKIAKRYGGGGHKGAAGFTVQNIMELIK